MIFSDRSLFDRQQNPLWMALDRLLKKGNKIIDLTESNPTRCHFSYPSLWLKSLSGRKNLYYNPDPRGSISARRAIVRYYRGLGISLTPDQLFLASGTSEVYHYLFNLILNRGDRLLVSSPGYPLLEHLAKINDVGIERFEYAYDGVRWRIDSDSLLRGIRRRPAAILVVNPNNPTGTYLDRDERLQLISMAGAAGLPIIADEVFFDYRYRGRAPEARSFASNRKSLTFTLNGLSKSVALPQLKLSWLVVTGPAGKVKEAARRLEFIADAYLSVNTPVQNGLGVILRERSKIQSQVIKRAVLNRNFLLRELDRRLPEGELLQSEGGWYAILRLPRIMTDDEWALTLLKREKVLAYPGHFFDLPVEAALVVSLIPPEPIFQKGVEKMIRLANYFFSIIG